MGFVLLLFWAWQVTSLETVDSSRGLARLAEVRDQWGPLRPLLERDSTGRLIRTSVPAVRGQAASELVVVVYRPTSGTFLQVEVPFWLLTMKGPALGAALRDTSFDIEELGLSSGELRALGACPILDETRADESELLVWTR